MRRDDFSFQLPAELIAEFPSQVRSDCRLMHLNGRTATLKHRRFPDILNLLESGDLLVFNDTKVLPARLFARKPTGGKVEVMLERVLADGTWLAQLGSSKPVRDGSQIRLVSNAASSSAPDSNESQSVGGDEIDAELLVLGREDGFFRLELRSELRLDTVFALAGHMPLPPYIKRSDSDFDQERYQTVYARHSGAVAAPTAGLHFDDDLLQALAERGVESSFVTLHVGAGTFQPVRAEMLADHQMHAESIHVPDATVTAIKDCHDRGGRVIAVGSTSVRSLESAAAHGTLEPFLGDSQLFIYPGFRFQVVDAMITNFHLSESSLLMMVCAFAGQEQVMGAYKEAVNKGYMFFSYGDAMFLEAAEAPALRGKP